MHFSIPDTEELNDGNGSTYMGYNVHINGIFHCTVRYKQLHNLHEQLKREFGPDVPHFPPKKILPLTSAQLEERRLLLEKYIQLVGQDSKIVSSNLFTGFLLSAQQETTCEKKQEMKLNIHTMSNTLISLRVLSTDRTQQVLLKACKQLNLPIEYISYFSLFLVKRYENGDISFLRKLQDFESPYISYKSIPDCNRIVIRTSYWDSEYDKELLTDPIALNLLYTQTASDIERDWILCHKEVKTQLAHLQARLAKIEYIELARTLKYYGYIQFDQCYCDYPTPQTEVLVAIGGQELSVRLLGRDIVEGSFKVTRMRCWRITATLNNKQSGAATSSNNSCLELSFEYLMAKDKLQWVTITSEQATLMSVCLQSLVDELLLKKNGAKRKRFSLTKGTWSYMRRDGSSHTISLDDPDMQPCSTNGDSGASKTQEFFSFKKLQEKFSSVTFKSGKECVENRAFEGIGDDDL